MAQMSRDSIAGGPGMAGQGVFRGGNPMYNGGGASAAYTGRQGVPDWGASATGAPTSRHDYGQRSADEMDDMSRGIYSAQPQQQMAYNPEAYGSYATYAQDNHVAAGGYQEATREYQGQNTYGPGGYHGQEFGGDVSYGVAVADPGRTSPPTAGTGAYPSALTPALRDQSNATAIRQQNARSVVHDDDVYGGI
ncbi:hypothetical protein AGABI1DRAFT_83050 [Agaricus bisporus var. burnettii JB137-S8]|uniref:Uncharacterized protein n=1 Tax=Agaricus bisporus var. burnettii (strain JB137-S8 / ATCC MYA-4627 / FGSC 10392) TaxID=597362 RepID=K5W484_AGABU|nr:uncharacterized protein AGABI1DRAFT_83050 [Agaricus bisporus var. burnettii JB137-S8]EKM81569.1 hypothetical protein AGABI1DRAFT_83050 [Agaricus bisporus var. burnettii JB137-S8]